MKTTSNDKIIKILKRMDDILQQNGLNQYQERIHRISKTLLSIEKHNHCFVSRFSVEHKNEDCVPVDINSFQTDISQLSLSFHDDPVLNIKEEGKHGMNEMLTFIEDELNMKRLVDESTTLSSSSSDSEGVKLSPKQNSLFANLQKKFFKIELKLRAYLKEQSANDVFIKANFESILNESKLRTPISKILPQFTTIRIIKNFFEDKDIVEEASKAKRMSVSEIPKEQLEKLEAIQKICKSNFDKLSCKDEGKEMPTHRISNFSEEVAIGLLMDVNGKGNSFNFAKRDSIFAERRSMLNNEFKFEEQLRDVCEIQSEDSISDSDSDSVSVSDSLEDEFN
jgi:hypothetical protein